MMCVVFQDCAFYPRKTGHMSPDKQQMHTRARAPMHTCMRMHVATAHTRIPLPLPCFPTPAGVCGWCGVRATLIIMEVIPFLVLAGGAGLLHMRLA